MSYVQLQSWVNAANSGTDLDNEVANIYAALNDLIDQAPAVGTAEFILTGYLGTPAVSSKKKKANGQLISDAESPYDGQRLPNLNGATITGIAISALDNTAKTVTISTDDVWALMIGDVITLTGATLTNGVVKAINYSTGVVTLGDSTLWSSGVYGLTTDTITGATALSSVGLKRFARGNASNSGGGGVNTLQIHVHEMGYVAGTPFVSSGGTGGSQSGNSLTTATITAAAILTSEPLGDGVIDTPRTGTETTPNYFDGEWYIKIK